MKVRNNKRELVRISEIYLNRVTELAVVKHEKERDFKKEGIWFLADWFGIDESSFEIVNKNQNEAFVKLHEELEASYYFEFIKVYEIES